MINFTIQNNGDSSQLVIELMDDSVYLEPNLVAYIVGNIALDANLGGVYTRMFAYYLGLKYYKPTFSGSGKLYLKPSLGSYHKLNLSSDEEFIIEPNAFIACPKAIKLEPQLQPSLNKFLSGTPMITFTAKGEGTIILLMPGPVVELKLNDDKFVSYGSNIACYSGLTVTREQAGSGWMSIAANMVKVYRGTGNLYFCPNPNKDTKVGAK